MNDFWIVIAEGLVNQGEIRSAQAWESEELLDRAGRFRFSMPAADHKADLPTAKRTANCYALIGGVVTLVGAGTIDEIKIVAGGDGALMLEIGGDNLLRELTNKQVGTLAIDDGAGGPDTSGPADIMTAVPFGWSLDTVDGYSSTLKSIIHTFEGETVLGALVKLAELTGEHFRLGSGRKVVWMRADQPDSGIRALDVLDPEEADDFPDLALITEIEKIEDSYDAYAGRIYAYGSGVGEARYDLNGASTGYSGYTVGNDSKGYYLQHTITWNAYAIERYMSFKDISDQRTLVEAAYEHLRTHLAPVSAYRMTITGLQQTLTPGSTVRCSYHRWVDGRHVVNIDDDFVILGVTNRIDAGGLRTVGLQVSSIDRWPLTDVGAIVDNLSQAGAFSTHPQPLPAGEVAGDITVQSAHIGGATNYLNVDASGNLTLHGTATVFDDVFTPATAMQLGGSADPGFAKLLDNGSGSQGVFTYLFDAAAVEELYFSVQLPRGYKEGSDITPRLHWAPTNTNTGTARWGLEYTWANIDGTLGNTTLVYAEDAGDGTAYKQQRADFAAIGGSGKTIGGALLCRVFRDAGHGNDTYNADAALLGLALQLELDTLGSNTETSK